MDSEKLLIIGCGDLGQRLAGISARRGIDVTGIRRRIPAGPPQAGLSFIRADYTRQDDLVRVLARGYDRIVLCPTPAERSDPGYRLGFVQLAGNLVQALAGQIPVKQILWVGSTSVYGQCRGEWIDESSPTHPVRYQGKRLLEAEALLRAAPLPVTIARLAGIYGPGRNRLINSLRTGRAKASAAFTNRIHIEDAARALDHLLYEVREPEELYLISDGEAASQQEVLSWLAARLGAAPPVWEDSDRLNKRIANRRLLGTGFRLSYPDFKAGFGSFIPPSP